MSWHSDWIQFYSSTASTDWLTGTHQHKSQQLQPLRAGCYRPSATQHAALSVFSFPNVDEQMQPILSYPTSAGHFQGQYQFLLQPEGTHALVCRKSLVSGSCRKAQEHSAPRHLPVQLKRARKQVRFVETADERTPQRSSAATAALLSSQQLIRSCGLFSLYNPQLQIAHQLSAPCSVTRKHCTCFIASGVQPTNLISIVSTNLLAVPWNAFLGFIHCTLPSNSLQDESVQATAHFQRPPHSQQGLCVFEGAEPYHLELLPGQIQRETHYTQLSQIAQKARGKAACELKAC